MSWTLMTAPSSARSRAQTRTCPTLAVEADELCEAAFGAAPALDRLRALAGLEKTDGQRRPVRARPDVGAEPAVRGAVPPCRTGVFNPARCGPARSIPEEASLTVLVPDLSVRWLRRHLITRGISSLADSDGPVLRLLALEEQQRQTCWIASTTCN